MATRTPLSPERILRAAMEHVDAHGLDALSMRTVAGLLGVEAMSLYHHVANKQALLDGLFDHAIRVADLPKAQGSSAEWIRGSAAALRRFAREHPRLMPLLASRPIPLDDPETAVPFEAGLGAFVRAGHDLPEAFASLQSVLLSLLSMAEVESRASLGAVGPESALTALPADDFPLLVAVADRGPELEDLWSTLIDGLVAGFSRPLT